MYSNLIPFTNVVDAVKDEIGSTNLRNQYPLIRRLMHRAQKEIGYGGSLLLKRVDYCISDGTILVDANGFAKVRLPADLIRIEGIGTCQFGMCPNDYRHQGNYLFLCKHVDNFALLYYSLLCDGEGNPTVSENHFEAVVAGIKYFMYQPKMWNGSGNRNYFKDLETYYEDRIGEAIGWDVFPTTAAEWAQISEKLRMSQRDMLIYDNDANCYSCFPQSVNNEILDPTIDNSDDMVYYWQYNDFTSDISLAPAIDQTFLDAQSVEPIQSFINGFTIPYNEIGRIGFAITNVNEDYYQIIDVFETDITTVVFDTYYNSVTRTQIYISKEYYSHGNIYYKLIKN